MGAKGKREHRITDDERRAVGDLRRAGVALTDIANRLSLSLSTVRWILAKAGIRATSAIRSANNRANYQRQSAAKLAARGCSSWDEVMERFAAARGGRHIGRFVNSTTPTRFICARGHRFAARPNNVTQGQWCRVCVVDARRVERAIYEQAAADRGWTLLSTEVTGVDEGHDWQCAEGHPVRTSLSSLRDGHGCRICAGNAPLTVEALHALAASRGWKFLDTEARGAQVDHLWECPRGHRVMRWPANVRWSNCADCSAGRHVSKGQRWVHEVVIHALPSGTAVLLPDRQAIKPLELDVYVPSLKLAFEFDGEYWHSITMLKGKEREARKERLCAERAIALHRIAERDFLDRRDETAARIVAIVRGAVAFAGDKPS